MYSFQPVVDMSQTHVGFYLVLALAVGLTWAAWWAFESIPTLVAFVVVFGSIVILTYNESFIESKPPVNEQVVGTFKGYLAEGFREQAGKYKVDRHVLWVIYTVPEGDVVLQGSEGNVYPKTAYLYKN